MRSKWAANARMAVMALAVIPAFAAAGRGKPAGPTQLAQPAQLMDLNRATVAELMRVPGMTATWANRIVRFRPYRTKLDLVEQGVVTPEVYQRIRASVAAHRAGSGK